MTPVLWAKPGGKAEDIQRHWAVGQKTIQTHANTTHKKKHPGHGGISTWVPKDTRAFNIIIERLGTQHHSTLRSNVYCLSRFLGFCYFEFLAYTKSWFVMCRGDSIFIYIYIYIYIYLYIYIYTSSNTPNGGDAKLLISLGVSGKTFYEMRFGPLSEPLSLDRNCLL